MMGLYIEILRFFFLGTWIWLVVGFEPGTHVGYELCFWVGRVIGTILGSVYELPIVTCDKRVIGSLEGFIDGVVEDKSLFFLFLYRLCTYVRMGILETVLSLYVYVVV